MKKPLPEQYPERITCLACFDNLLGPQYVTTRIQSMSSMRGRKTDREVRAEGFKLGSAPGKGSIRSNCRKIDQNDDWDHAVTLEQL
jgi:hypothetical protein